jgi:hypothetical protein
LFLFICTTANAAVFGTINSANKYAKIYSGVYAGTQINFRPNDASAVQGIEVYSDRIRGYAWSDVTGWIVFSCEDTANGCTDGDFKVTNDSLGHLSGYAWGQNTGWISFSCSNPTSSCNSSAGNWGVSIVSGNFTGYAWSQNYGYIQFDCNVSGACVSTDWRASIESNPGVVPLSFLQQKNQEITKEIIQNIKPPTNMPDPVINISESETKLITGANKIQKSNPINKGQEIKKDIENILAPQIRPFVPSYLDIFIIVLPIAGIFSGLIILALGLFLARRNDVGKSSSNYKKTALYILFCLGFLSLLFLITNNATLIKEVLMCIYLLEFVFIYFLRNRL